MGRARLVLRLAVRNLRRRPVEAALLSLAIVAATTTFTLGLALHGVTDDPYMRTRAATAGPDVLASVEPDHVDRNLAVPADVAGLEELIDAEGVVAHSGPHPAIVADLEANGVTVDAWAEGREAGAAPVDRPRLTEGDWVEDGGVVVEAAFAEALDVGAGDEVTLNGRTFRVAGVAVTAASSYSDVCFGMTCSFIFGSGDMSQVRETPVGQAVPVELRIPPDEAGLVWLTDADARGLAPGEAALSYSLGLQLADPADAAAFAEEHASGSVFVASWPDIREVYGELVQDQQIALVTGGWLLAVLAMASAAVLVGGRIADQTRRVGSLKAVGGTPSLVALVLLAEYTILALLAAAIGLGAGRLAAPLLVDPGAGLLGSAGPPSLTPSRIALVVALAVGVAAIASVVPAVRAATTSTVRALADRARQPRRSPWLIKLSARLPVPLLLGLRMAARRPRRVLLAVASVVVTVSGIVAVMAARAQVDADWDDAAGLDPNADRLNQVLSMITVMLVGLAAINAVFITWATALDARHSSALARALGATPHEVSTGLSAAQVLPALVGAALGIPGGLGLWAALSGDEVVNPPLWQVVAVVPVTVAVVAGLTTIPARLHARRSIAETLHSEAA